MTLTLPDNPVSPPTNDRWHDVDIPPALAHAGRVFREEAPRIARPSAFTSHRVVLAVLTVAVLGLSLQFGGMVAAADASPGALQTIALALAVTTFAASVAFGAWALRQRTTIDELRWRSFRRPAWGGWWSVVWAATPAGALVAFSVLAAVTDGLLWSAGILVALVAVRAMSLRALGTNMKRVVLGARRWTTAGALSIAIADYLLVVIVWATLIEPQLDRDLLRVPASALPFVVLLSAVFMLGYAKRVERWVLEWWDTRWGCTEQDVMVRLIAVGFLGGKPGRFGGRRLFPTAPLRLLVVLSYVALAATTAWAGWTTWTRREDLGDTDGLSSSLDRLDEVSFGFVAALLVMQACHAAWCIAQAWNARRCTLGAPGILGTAVLFLLAPGIVAAAVAFVDDTAMLALIAAFAVVVNLACWALSFSLLSRMLEALDRSTRRVASWGSVVAMHWVLLFGVRSIVLVDDATVFAGLVLTVAIVDAMIFLAAAVYADRAMRHVEQATRDYEQIRRRPVSRQRRRHRAPGGILAAELPIARADSPKRRSWTPSTKHPRKRTNVNVDSSGSFRHRLN